MKKSFLGIDWYAKKTKTFAYVLLVVSAALMVKTFVTLAPSFVYGGMRPLSQPYYLQSDALAESMSECANVIWNVIDFYKNEQNVMQGGAVNQDMLESHKSDLYYQKYNEWLSRNESLNSIVHSLSVEADVTLGNVDVAKVLEQYLTQSSEMLAFTGNYDLDKSRFENAFAEQIEGIRQQAIQNSLDDYNYHLWMIQQFKGLLYYANNGQDTLANYHGDPENYTETRAYYVSDGTGVLSSMQQMNPSSYYDYFNYSYAPYTIYSYNSYSYQRHHNNLIGTDKALYITFTDDFLNEQITNWNVQRKKLLHDIVIFSVTALECIALFVYLAYVSGKSKKEDAVRLISLDRLYLEFNITAMLTVMYLWGLLYFDVCNGRWGANGRWGISVLYIPEITLILANSLMLALLLSLARRFKHKTLLSHSLTFSVLRGIARLFNGYLWRDYKFARSMMLRQVVFVVTEATLMLCVLAAIGSHAGEAAFVFTLIAAAVCVFYLRGNFKTFRQFGAIASSISDIANGEMQSVQALAYAIPATSNLFRTAQDLTKIHDGLETAIQAGIKAERLKVDLVTNISHDLKTPLTSIVSYVDLLSQETDLPEHVTDYIKVLSTKSERLKEMIEDLFQLAKATSGSITVDAENVDFAKLLRQTLADMDEAVTASGLQFKLNIPAEPVIIYADGKKMYRVFENLISNALKYSLDGTRVHITLQTQDKRAAAFVKNTANYEMNFDSEDMLERFTRADCARSTEGSGLGLSIAKSFTEACGGQFDVKTDADLFVAKVEFETV